MKNLVTLVSLATATVLACDSSGENYSPKKWLIGLWKVTSSVTEYKACDWGDGPDTQYNEHNPEDDGHFRYMFNEDGSWSYEWVSSIGLSEHTGTWHLSDGWLSLEYLSGTLDMWRLEFEGRSVLHFSNETNCTGGGTRYHYRKLERLD